MRTWRVVFWGATLGLLLPAALLTLSRAADVMSGRLVRVESFTPLAIPAYAVVLVATVACLASRHSRRVGRVPLTLVTLVAAVGLVLHGAWFSAQVLGANPPAAAGAERLTVMTANLYAGEADGIELVRIASEEDVDVLVVEEITATALAAMDRAGMGSLYPSRVGAADDMDSDGTMVFSRLPLGESRPVLTGHDSWLVPVGDLTLLAVHAFAPTDVAQWRADHDTIRAAASVADPDLIVGDFNATLDHRPMRTLASRGWRSVAELANEGWQPTWPANGLSGFLGLPLPALVQIDHVLVGSRLAAVSSRTVDLPGTDHLAVIAEVARK